MEGELMKLKYFLILFFISTLSINWSLGEDLWLENNAEINLDGHLDHTTDELTPIELMELYSDHSLVDNPDLSLLLLPEEKNENEENQNP